MKNFAWKLYHEDGATEVVVLEAECLDDAYNKLISNWEFSHSKPFDRNHLEHFHDGDLEEIVKANLKGKDFGSERRNRFSFDIDNGFGGYSVYIYADAHCDFHHFVNYVRTICDALSIPFDFGDMTIVGAEGTDVEKIRVECGVLYCDCKENV